MSWFGRNRGHPGKVVVVGAGLQGLAAARRLRIYGFDVTVLDRNSQPGGACRSIVDDEGYVLDRGFHVAPGGSLDEVCDPAAYQPLLRSLGASYLHGSTGSIDLEEARQFTLQATARDQVVGDVRGTAYFVAMAPSVHPDRPWADVLGQDRPALTAVYRAISMSTDGSASFNETNDIVEAWLGGSGALLSGGMADLVRLMSQDIAVTPGVDVERIERGPNSWLVHTNRGPIASDLVISPAHNELPAGHLDWTCCWLAAPEAPTQSKGVEFWPLSHQASIHTCVVSNVAPERAPQGALIAATWNGPDIDVRKRLGELYGRDTSTWRPLAQQRFASALPSLPNREVARGHWELGRTYGHVASIRLGGEVADSVAAKQLGIRALGPLGREERKRAQWIEAAWDAND